METLDRDLIKILEETIEIVTNKKTNKNIKHYGKVSMFDIFHNLIIPISEKNIRFFINQENDKIVIKCLDLYDINLIKKSLLISKIDNDIFIHVSNEQIENLQIKLYRTNDELYFFTENRCILFFYFLDKLNVREFIYKDDAVYVNFDIKDHFDSFVIDKSNNYHLLTYPELKINCLYSANNMIVLDILGYQIKVYVFIKFLNCFYNIAIDKRKYVSHIEPDYEYLTKKDFTILSNMIVINDYDNSTIKKLVKIINQNFNSKIRS